VNRSNYLQDIRRELSVKKFCQQKVKNGTLWLAATLQQIHNKSTTSLHVEILWIWCRTSICCGFVLDLLWICCTANPQQIRLVEFVFYWLASKEGHASDALACISDTIIVIGASLFVNIFIIKSYKKYR